MKKIIGSLLLIVGLIVVTASAIAATEIDCAKRKLWDKAMEAFDPATKFRLDSEQRVALLALLFGIILFIAGLILVLVKTRKQKDLENEVLALRLLKEEQF